MIKAPVDVAINLSLFFELLEEFDQILGNIQLKMLTINTNYCKLIRQLPTKYLARWFRLVCYSTNWNNTSKEQQWWQANSCTPNCTL